jgi:hypothetical protein
MVSTLDSSSSDVTLSQATNASPLHPVSRRVAEYYYYPHTSLIFSPAARMCLLFLPLRTMHHSGLVFLLPIAHLHSILRLPVSCAVSALYMHM